MSKKQKPQPPRKNQTLAELLSQLPLIDEELPPEEFDPAQWAGDIKGKVDALDYKLKEWKARAKFLNEMYIQPFQRTVKALNGKKEKLEDYILEEMLKNECEKIPGSAARVQVQESGEWADIAELADAKLCLKFPELVLQETTYQWDKKKVLERAQKENDLPFVTLKRTKYVKFYRTGEPQDEPGESISDDSNGEPTSRQEQSPIRDGDPEALRFDSRTLVSGSEDGVAEEPQTPSL